jgi:hypothetical protein
VDKVAPLAIHAMSLFQIDSAFLGFVFRVGLLVFAQFMRAMGKFALLLVGTKAKLQVFFAELRFFFILPYGRFAAVRWLLISRRGGT